MRLKKKIGSLDRIAEDLYSIFSFGQSPHMLKSNK
jgi:hypothetical protein